MANMERCPVATPFSTSVRMRESTFFLTNCFEDEGAVVELLVLPGIAEGDPIGLAMFKWELWICEWVVRVALQCRMRFSKDPRVDQEWSLSMSGNKTSHLVKHRLLIDRMDRANLQKELFGWFSISQSAFIVRWR